MIRRSRRIQPALDQLEKKTMLSVGQLGHLAGGTTASPLVRDATKYYYGITIATSGFVAKDVQWSFDIFEKTADNKLVEKKLAEGKTGDIVPDQLRRIESPATTSDGSYGFFDFRYKVDGQKERDDFEADIAIERRAVFEGPVTVYFLPQESPDDGGA